MRQVVSRRFCHYLDGDKGFDERPDALLIDGGTVHAETVRETLAAMQIELPIFGMVRDDRHRTRALVTPDGREIGIQSIPAVFALIGRIQEETHRFAITYHRTLRSRRMRGSQLDRIPASGRSGGWRCSGPSARSRRSARRELPALCAVVPEKTAEAVYAFFRTENKKE